VSSESARRELPRVQLSAVLNHPSSHHHLRKLSRMSLQNPDQRSLTSEASEAARQLGCQIERLKQSRELCAIWLTPEAKMAEGYRYRHLRLDGSLTSSRGLKALWAGVRVKGFPHFTGRTNSISASVGLLNFTLSPSVLLAKI